MKITCVSKVMICVFFAVVFVVSFRSAQFQADTSFAINRMKIAISWTSSGHHHFLNTIKLLPFCTYKRALSRNFSLKIKFFYKIPSSVFTY